MSVYCAVHAVYVYLQLMQTVVLPLTLALLHPTPWCTWIHSSLVHSHHDSLGHAVVWDIFGHCVCTRHILLWSSDAATTPAPTTASAASATAGGAAPVVVTQLLDNCLAFGVSIVSSSGLFAIPCSARACVCLNWVNGCVFNNNLIKCSLWM